MEENFKSMLDELPIDSVSLSIGTTALEKKGFASMKLNGGDTSLFIRILLG